MQQAGWGTTGVHRRRASSTLEWHLSPLSANLRLQWHLPPLNVSLPTLEWHLPLLSFIREDIGAAP